MTEIIIKEPITTLTSKITNGSAIALAILAIVISSGMIGQTDIYACQDTQIAMHCDSLSKINTEGTQTRCYYFSEELNKTSYKKHQFRILYIFTLEPRKRSQFFWIF